jgi:UDP-glucuronate 4-epimerase
MAKIFITGAAGFIGFHLAQRLAKRGDQVVGYDNFNDYYLPELKRQREAILAKQGIKVITGDICDVDALQCAIEQHQTTHLVHLAAQAGVRYSLSHPHAYIKANIEGFTNILEICRKNSGMKLIYASSSSVYGRNRKIPFSIEDPTDEQASFYGVTKKSNELMASTYHHLYKIPVTGLRFFTVYGPWGRPDMAYFSFAQAIVEGKPIEVFNHGKMRRDFTYIDDIVSGTVAAIDLGAECELFNLGNHQPVDVMEMVFCLEEALGKKAKVHFLPMQPGDVLETFADIRHSTQKLGFIPKISLKEGLLQFVDWYKHWKLNISRR